MRRGRLVPVTPVLTAAGVTPIYDTGEVPANALPKDASGYSRVRSALYIDQVATFRVRWAAPGSTNLRTVASVAIAANDYFQRDTLLQPGRTVIDVVMGPTPATVFEAGAELVEDQSLGQ